MTFDPESLRKDFPPLKPNGGGAAPIYFDNACTSLRPLQVVDAINEYYFEHPACHKRSVHAFGRRTSERYRSARESAQRFLNAGEAEEIVFTRNSTEGINLVAAATRFKKGERVVTTDIEHNSNLIPWRRLAEQKEIRHTTIPVQPNGRFDLEGLRAAVKEGARLVSVFSHSHVLGIASPLADIITIAHEKGAQVLVDAAQTPLHEPLDVRALDIDFLVLSFHKMLGPSGMGLLYGKRKLLEAMSQFLTGGETVESVDDCGYTASAIPHKFEAGLQNYAGAMGAEAAILYLEAVGRADIRAHELKLNALITEALKSSPRARLLGPPEPERRGSIINFYVDGMDSGELSILLDKSENIMTRSGVHCAHAWYARYKVPPSLRASLSFYNTTAEAEALGRAIRNFDKYF